MNSSSFVPTISNFVHSCKHLESPGSFDSSIEHLHGPSELVHSTESRGPRVGVSDDLDKNDDLMTPNDDKMT